MPSRPSGRGGRHPSAQSPDFSPFHPRLYFPGISPGFLPSRDDSGGRGGGDNKSGGRGEPRGLPAAPLHPGGSGGSLRARRRRPRPGPARRWAVGGGRLPRPRHKPAAPPAGLRAPAGRRGAERCSRGGARREEAAAGAARASPAGREGEAAGHDLKLPPRPGGRKPTRRREEEKGGGCAARPGPPATAFVCSGRPP